MLVGAFEIEVGRPALLRPAAAFQHEGVRAAAVEPYVQDVGDLLEVVGVAPFAQEALRSAFLGPGVHALLTNGGDNAGVNLRIDEILAGLAVDEQRDRYAPGALAGDDPVGPVVDHRADAVAALFGDEAGIGDG